MDYDEEEEPITLGFVDRPNNQWSLRRQYFPSKAGGFPAWLDPLNIPSGRSFLCDICGDPLRFLLQVYAPIEKETTFHRMLFVFMCPSMECLVSVKVFRCQLPRVNPFYSPECPQYDESYEPASSGAALCDWCGTWKGKFCSNCRQVRYCSQKHQNMSWRSGHKNACHSVSGPKENGTTSLESHKASAWPEFVISIEDESEYNRHMDYYEGDDDKKSWASFQVRIANASEQVLRYYRNTNAKPIWPISSGRPTNANIPRCSHCSGPMCCEFQILPQLLYYFGVKNEVDSLD